jgi:hypothetical protein
MNTDEQTVEQNTKGEAGTAREASSAAESTAAEPSGESATGTAPTDGQGVASEPPAQPKLPVKLEAHSGGVLAIIPRDLEEAGKMARGIIASGIVPKAFKHAENVRDADDKIIHAKGDPNQPLIIMGILKALEVGLPPITGLSYLLPINDRFTIWGDGAVALAQAKGLIVNHKKTVIGPALQPGLELADWPDEYGVEVRFWRKGQEDPYVGRYTVGDAKRARLWMNINKKPWIENPDRMLFNRARAFALRDGFADALSGLSIAEEVRDMTPEPIDGGELHAISAKKSALDDDE